MAAILHQGSLGLVEALRRSLFWNGANVPAWRVAGDHAGAQVDLGGYGRDASARIISTCEPATCLTSQTHSK